RGAFATSPAARGRWVQTRVINYKVDVREILRDFLDVFRMTVFFVEQPERKPLVNADSFHAELAASLPERIRDFLIVEPERPVTDQRAGIHFPRIDLERLDLALHLFELG